MFKIIRRSGRLAAATLLVAGTAGGALAQDSRWDFSGDHNGAREIRSGDYAKAEHVLLRSLSTSPSDPELMLNLATVYALSHRTSQAQTLYRQVLTRPEETLRLSGGRARSSYDLANTGLRAIHGVQLTAR